MLAVLALTLLPQSAAALAPGAADPSFGSRGVISPRGLSVQEVLPQADGSLLVLGTRGIAPPRRTVLQRRHGDGSQDLAFGGSGEVFVQAPRSIGPASFHSAWQYDDGRLLLMGWAESDGEGNEFDVYEERIVLARLLASGAPDPTFSRDGFLSRDVYTGLPESEFMPIIRPIVDPADPSRLGLEVSVDHLTTLETFDAAGRLDTSFGEDGALVVDVHALEAARGEGRVGGAPVGWAHGPGGTWFLAARSWRYADKGGGGVICPGGCALATEDEHWLRLHRYASSGTLDSSFAAGGIALVADPGPPWPSSWPPGGGGDVFTLTDGRLLVLEAGFEDSTTITRWLPSGALDPSWSSDGQASIATPAFGTGGSLSLTHAVLDAQGRLVLSLARWFRHADDARLVRVTTSGEVDDRFDPDGSWVPLTRGRGEPPGDSFTINDAPFAIDRAGRIVWWSDTGSLSCCPYRGKVESLVGVVAGGDAAATQPTLRIAVEGRTCGRKRRFACVVLADRPFTITGQLQPVPPAGARSVYVSRFDCEGRREFVRGTRVGEDGSFRLRMPNPRYGSQWTFAARREAHGDMRDVVSARLWGRRLRSGSCEL